MSSSETALEKLLNRLVTEKYPSVKNVVVSADDEDITGIYTYVVNLNIKYDDAMNEGEDIKNYVRTLAKYILPDKHYIRIINYYFDDSI